MKKIKKRCTNKNYIVTKNILQPIALLYFSTVETKVSSFIYILQYKSYNINIIKNLYYQRHYLSNRSATLRIVSNLSLLVREISDLNTF